MERIKNQLHLKNAVLTNPRYPNCLINSTNMYEEQIMSMPGIINQIAIEKEVSIKSGNLERGHYFFFIYNLENYYHFIYDTLPYLVYYFDLKNTIEDLKILLPENHKWLPFQKETMELLGIYNFQYANNNSCYENLYISSSLTHGKNVKNKFCSNMAPDELCRSVWNRLKIDHLGFKTKKIYISRRSWLHGDFSNIGTNYTLRRRCLNEDKIVELLEMHGYQEVFMEKLNMEEKLKLVSECSDIIGFIGGGLANLLFAHPSTKVGCIETPFFLDINKRFKYCMENTNITYLPITSLAPFDGPWPLCCRVKVIDNTSEFFNRICEIVEWKENTYLVNISNNDVAGFVASEKYIQSYFYPIQLQPIDQGLNSPFVCDINKLSEYLQQNESHNSDVGSR